MPFCGDFRYFLGLLGGFFHFFPGFSSFPLIAFRFVPFISGSLGLYICKF